MIELLAIGRILLCGYGALLCIRSGYRLGWCCFLLMILTNYLIHFHRVDQLTLELVRSLSTTALFIALTRR